MSDTPRVDAAAVSREFIAREMDHYAHKFVLADFARQLERELAEAQRDAGTLADVLLRNGFVRCDIPACNCGSWHHRYGLPERMDEIREALRDADVLDNSTGNLPLNAIKKLVAQRDEARRDAERYRWLCASGNYCPSPFGGWGMITGHARDVTKATLDAAIDAALKAKYP